MQSSFSLWAIRTVWSSFCFLSKLTGVVASILTAGLYLFQNKLIYPAAFPPGSRDVVDNPDRYGLSDWEDVNLVGSDGVVVKMFAILARHPDHPDHRLPTFCLFHANAGNVGHRLPVAAAIVKRMNCHVLALSYRGYGHSSGAPSEAGILLDVEAMFKWIAVHPIFAHTPLILYGQSLGGAVAIAAASVHSYRRRIAGVIIENTFYNMRSLIPHVMPFLKHVTFLCHQTWNSNLRIQQLDKDKDHQPWFLFMAGEKDELIPPAHFRMLFDHLPVEHKKWIGFENGTHNDTCLQPDYFKEISLWIKSLPLHDKFTLLAD